MPQKFFDPLRKLPYQIQNLSLVQKLHGLTHSRSNDTFGSLLSSVYGCPRSPTAMAFDERLGLFALGTKSGSITIYGAAGVAFHVCERGSTILFLQFLPEEGRLISADIDGKLCMFQLNTKTGIWSRGDTLGAVMSNDRITALALGHGILYVGCRSGSLHQVAVKDGRMFVGDSTLTSLTSSMVTESLPMDKRNQLGMDSPIVAIESQPGGNQLLVAYAGGCVIVTIPQPVPTTNGVAEHETTTTCEDVVAADVDPVTQKPQEGETTAETDTTQTPTKTDTKRDSTTEDEPTAELNVPSTPQRTKLQTEKKSSIIFKELTKSLRRPDSSKVETEITAVHIPVPPPPRVSHVLLRDQQVQWATWKLTNIGGLASELTVAYEDGAFQNWPISTVSDVELSEPIMVAERDPSTSPYGPLPCGPMEKVLQSPSRSGGVLTAFSGGLPRAQFSDRHTISLLHNQEIMVCFQFGSRVIDFVFIPKKPEPGAESNEVQSPTDAPVTTPCAPQYATALLVITDRELVAIDLEQSNWPTFDPPYLTCLDAAPITTIAHVTEVPQTLLSHLKVSLFNSNTSSSNWPIWGGGADDQTRLDINSASDLVLLGHVNGLVSLIAVGKGNSACRLGSFHTDILFNMTDSTQQSSRQPIEVETWPPFRLVGNCALAVPCCNTDSVDPRLAVCHLSASVSKPTEEDVSSSSPILTVIVGGAAGQVSVWECSVDEHAKKTFEPDVCRIRASLYEPELTEHPKYIWNGLNALMPFEGVTGNGPAMIPRTLIQLQPPSPVTAVAMESAWNILVVGCSHGFVVVDLLAKAAIHTEFLLDQSPDGHSASAAKSGKQASTVQAAIVNRSKQFSASMRQSFRRLKHLRTSTMSKTTTETNNEPDQQTAESASTEVSQHTDSPAAPITETDIPTADASETTPHAPEQPTLQTVVDAPREVTSSSVQSQLAEESEQLEQEQSVSEVSPEPISICSEDCGSCTVRTVILIDTYVVSPIPATADHPAVPSIRTPSLWVGTASGKVIAYSLDWDEMSGPVSVVLHKELQLHHHASIIGLCVIDSLTNMPVSRSSRTRLGCELVPKPTVEPVPSTEPVAEPQPESTPMETDGSEQAAATEPQPTQTPAPPATPRQPADIHHLLLCSEEHVKLFQLPSLRAMYKHRFVDRPLLPIHLSGSGGGSVSAPASAAPEQKQVVESEKSTEPAVTSPVDGDQVIQEPQHPVDEPKSADVTAVVSPFHTVQPHHKSLTGFGVHAFHRGTANEQSKVEWNVVVTRFDGKIAVLSLPHLRQVHKVSTVLGEIERPSLCRVTTLSQADLIFWQSHSQLLAVELSPTPRLSSACQMVLGKLPSVSISLPLWARPVEPTPAPEVVPAEDIGAAAPGETSPVNGEAELNGTKTDESELTSKSQHPAVGDITMDSVKEYLNGEGTVTIKTIETSSEKRTLVERGNVMTTVRETESVDGKLVKDEVHKFSTQGDTGKPCLTAAPAN